MTSDTKQFVAAEAFARAGKLDAALKAYSQILQSDPGNTQARYRVAVVELMRGRIPEGEKQLRTCLRDAPDDPDILYSLGRACAAQGAHEDAIKHLTKASDNAPDRPDIRSALGDAHFLYGAMEPALRIYHSANALAPKDLRIKVNMAHAYSRLRDHKNALAAIRAAFDLAPDRADIALAYANTLRAAGELHEARKVAEDLRAHMPEDVAVIACNAEILDRLGESENAAALLAPLLGRHPDSIELARACGQIMINQAQDALPLDRVLGLMDGVLARPHLNRFERRGLLFMQATLLQKSGETSAAFETCTRANAEAAVNYDRDRVNRRFDRYRNTFSLGRLPRLSRSSIIDETPLFIVGMPRSGTSLVEQILDSHPDVTGGGELGAIPGAAQTLANYPDTLESLNNDDLDIIAQSCLAELRAISGTSRFVTDKMPINAEHLGFIWQLFPGARVIHCRRHPLAIGLSCFFQNFRTRNEFTFSLEGFAHYYRHYDALMTHWQSSLDLPVFEVRYETLTAAPQQNIAELLSFCDLPWDDACLAFDKNKRFVETLSYAQVRQPISQEPSARHLKYAEQLKPLAEALADEIARYEAGAAELT